MKMVKLLVKTRTPTGTVEVEVEGTKLNTRTAALAVIAAGVKNGAPTATVYEANNTPHGAVFNVRVFNTGQNEPLLEPRRVR